MGIPAPHVVSGFPQGCPGWPIGSEVVPHLRLQGFYEQVANPLLVDVELLYPPDAVSALTQHRHKQYYEGSEIMVAGRIADNKLGSFKADVLARGVNGGLRRGERSGSTQRLQICTCSPPLFPLPRGTMPLLRPRPEHSHPPGAWGGLEWDPNGLD